MKAIILNLIAWAVLPIMDGMAKHLSTEIHFLEVVWGRYFFMVAISVPITFVFFKGNENKGEFGAFHDFQKKYPEILFRRIFDYGYGSSAFIAYKTN